MGLGQPLILTDHQILAGFLCCSHHGLALFQGDRHRLLAQNMLAGFQRGDGNFSMGMVGSANTDSLDFGVSQQLLVGSKCLAAVLYSQFLRSCPVNIIEAVNFRMGIGCILGDMTNLRDLSTSDDTYFDAHVLSSLY